jgi:WD40 repeat protein
MSLDRRWWFAGLLAAAAAQPVSAQDRADLPRAAAAGRGGLPAGAVARLGQTRLRHPDKPTCVAFSPDGKSFVTGGDDGSVHAWSVATGERLNGFQKPGVAVAAIRFTHGGKRLAIHFDAAGVIQVLDPVTFRELESVPLPTRQTFAFSADGALFAASDPTGGVVVTEAATELPKLELSGVTHFDFRPDGKALVTGDAKGNVTVHLVTGGKPTFAAKHDGPILGLAYRPDGKRLAVGSRSADGSGVVRVYEPGRNESLKPVAEIAGMNWPSAWVGDDALAVGNGSEAGVYDLDKKRWVGRVKEITGEFAVSPDGTRLAATGPGLQVRLFDLATGRPMHAENDTFPEPALLAGSADGRTVFLLTSDAAYLWPVGAAFATPAGKLPARAVAAVDALVVATPDAVLLYAPFDPTEGLPEKPAHTFKDSAGARAVAVAANGSRVAWAAKDGKVIVTDPADRTGRRELATTSAVLALGFNPAGDRLGVLGRDPYLRVWDVSRVEPKEVWKARVQRGQKGVVAFSRDGTLLTAVSTAQLAVFDAKDGTGTEPREPAYRFERYTDSGAIQHAAFTPDGRAVVVGSVGPYGRVEVWELASRGLVRALATGYGGTSRLCVFPDGTRAASAGAEEAVTVWDLTFGPNRPPKPDDLATAVKNLATPDAAVGYPAAVRLSAAGDRGTAALRGPVADAVAYQGKLDRWVADLGSETVSIRETARKELLAQGARAVVAVSAASRSDPPAVRDRARELMIKFNDMGVTLPPSGLTADGLGLVRAVQALEAIGTPAARSVLEGIAAADGPPATEARLALRRLKKK